MLPPEKIEVKLAFMSEDTAKAFAVLGLSDPPKEEKRIHFFDTGNLALFDRGLILRVRQTVAGGDPDDATLKVRGPGAPDAASGFLATAGSGAKFEGDQNVGREEAPSFSITTEPGGASIAAVVTDLRKLEFVLNETGKTLFHKIGGAEADRTVIKCLGLLANLEVNVLDVNRKPLRGYPHTIENPFAKAASARAFEVRLPRHLLKQFSKRCSPRINTCTLLNSFSRRVAL